MTLNELVSLHLKVQKLRVGRELRLIQLYGVEEYDRVKKKLKTKAKVRNELLDKTRDKDPITVSVYEQLLAVEDSLGNEIKKRAESHPAWPWLQRVKGCGCENTMKVIGLIDSMRERVEITKDEYERLKKEGVDVVERNLGGRKVYYRFTGRRGLAAFSTVSKLWKFAGMHVVDGHAPRRTKGAVLDWNCELRTMCWRLARSLIRARGVYYQEYLKAKEGYLARFKGKIVKSKKGVKVPEGYISLKHLDNMAVRKMIKLWLAHLWEVTRRKQGLPVRASYVVEKLGHHYIPPLVDVREEMDSCEPIDPCESTDLFESMERLKPRWRIGFFELP